MLALAFSFLFTGLGQFYNGQIGKGLLFVAIQLVNFALIYWFVGLLTAPAFWLYGMLEAVETAARMMEEAERETALVAKDSPAPTKQ
jgi:TM2 domain-containing membrane protein YozV